MLVHVVAIALGIYLGFIAMDAIAPDLPGADVEPGVSSSSAPQAVVGDDTDSLFRAANLGPALAQLDEQLAAGEGIASCTSSPARSTPTHGSAEGMFAAADVAGRGAGEARGRDRRRAPGRHARSPTSRFMDLVATPKGPRWYVQLDINRDIGPPPWTYGAPLDGAPLSVGGAPPKPIDG